MTKANECTCPSGDGSLVHPCPAHPAVEQAGGDERALQAEGAQDIPSPVSQEYDRHLISLLRKGEALPGHQEEAADEIERLRDWNDHLNNTVLPNILNPNFLMLMKGGERLLDLCTKDGKFIGVSLNDMKDVFDWMVTHARIAPDHAALAQPSPAQAEKAEAERPIVSFEKYMQVMYDRDENAKRLDAALARVAGLETALSSALSQHGVKFMDPPDGGDTPLIEQVYRMSQALSELEKQEPVATIAKVPGEDWNGLHFYRDLQGMQPGTKLYAAPVAQAQQLHDLDKQCRDDVARALGLRPSQERGFAWSYLLASIKSCVKASEDAAQAQHSVPEGWMLVECGIWTQEQVDEMQKTVTRFRNSEFVDDRALAMAVADAGQCKAPEISLAELLAAAPGKEGA